MEIKDILKQRRNQLGLTLAQVAAHVGVSEATVSRWESGNIENMRRSRLAGLTEILQLDPSILTGSEKSTFSMTPPTLAEDVVVFPVIGEIACGFEHIALEDYDTGDSVEIPASLLKGHPRSDYFVLRVSGDSMYPLYMDGDMVLILKTPSLERSGEIGAVIYEDYATLKKIEYVSGEDWMKLVPVNPQYQPKTISGADLEQCKILGIPKLLIRQL
jgi:repressor LexA